MKTLPNIADPVLLVTSAATRIQSRMAYARSVLVEQQDPDRPLIEVEMAGRSQVRRVHRMALHTLARLGMDHSVLHAIQQRVDQEAAEQRSEGRQDSAGWPGTAGLSGVRPIQGRNFRFPVGRGVGMHYCRELDRHVRSVLGDAAVSPQIHLETRRGFKQAKKEELLASPNDVDRSRRTMGFDHLRIVCLWNKDENRLRMIEGLCGAYGLDSKAVDPADGQPVPLYGETISAVFHRAPDFLTHGPDGGQPAGLDHVEVLKPQPGTLLGAWAETEYDSRDDADLPDEDGDEDEDAQPADASAPGGEQDAKYRGRRTLARLGVVSQYTADRRSSRPRPGSTPKDHQVIMSLMDLNRSLGIIDRRIDNVMVDRIGPYPANGMAHCGIHVRRQSRQGRDRTSKICITASVLKPPTREGDAWTLHSWSYTDPQWRPYHQAQAAFHAADYPSGKMTEFDDDNRGYKKVAERIDQALADLSVYLDGTPYTVTVDGFSTRRLWDGLHNKRQGEPARPSTTWLPGGTSHPDDRPVAVIRINKHGDEVPRPISVSFPDSEKKDPGKTTTMLYRVEPDFGRPAWLLVTVPPQFDGKGARRLGENKTRWSADHGSSDPNNLSKNEMSANWYAMTATEIYPVPLREQLPAEVLATVTARLCHQSLAWSNRTRYPVQLHAAQQMDLDHPQYRRTALQPDQDIETTETGAPEN
jgi:hypothetical protein